MFSLLKSKGMKVPVITLFAMAILQQITAQQKKIYMALDDHTDYMCYNLEEEGQQAFVRMLDYYIKLNDSTTLLPYPYQNKWNCDGSFWIYTYEKNRTHEQFEHLMDQVKKEKITFPLNAIMGVYGIAPAEATLRGMYYAGTLERRYGLDLKLAYTMEDQVMPLGLASLWAGSGAKYSWHGVCACATKLKGLKTKGIVRPHEIYWYKGLDEQKILMKWNTISWDNMHLGGYAEAAIPEDAVSQCNELMNDKDRYPYNIIGAFGAGWDNTIYMTSKYINEARRLSNRDHQVILSNEIDFFEDFEKNYGNLLPSESLSYGTTEWGINLASLADASASIKRSMEKLRSAEALYTYVSLKDKNFAGNLNELRSQAWMACGLFYEHDWTADGGVTRHERAQWGKKMANQLKSYVDTLYNLSLSGLSALLYLPAKSNEIFYVFNPLGWSRTDYSDYPYKGPTDIHIIDRTKSEEVPFQFIYTKNTTYLRILATDVPSIGYKVYEIVPGNGTLKMENAGYYIYFQNFVETPFYKIVFMPDGSIKSLIDKANNNTECVRQVENLSMNDMMPDDEKKGMEVKVENDGPVSMTLVAQSEFPVKHTSKLTLFRNSRRIELENYITRNFGDNPVTYSFSANVMLPEIWHEEAGAILLAKPRSKGGHYAEKFCRLDWLGMNHFAEVSNEGYGITISNRDASFMQVGNSRPDSLDDASPRINILAGGRIDADRNLGIPNQDGDSYFENYIALNPHNGPFDPTSAMKFSLEHQNPLVAAKITGTSEQYPSEQFSLLSISDPNVLVWALKPAEEGIDKGIVLRVWNTSNDEAKYTIHLASQIVSCKRISHIETDEEEIKPVSGEIKTVAGHNRIHSYRMLPGK
jgi:alpha-mannosidase